MSLLQASFFLPPVVGIWIEQKWIIWICLSVKKPLSLLALMQWPSEVGLASTPIEISPVLLPSQTSSEAQ